MRSQPFYQWWYYCLCGSLIVLNITTIIVRLRPDGSPKEHAFTYVGDDYPSTLPITPLDSVAMTLQESVHYTVNRSDPLASSAWHNMVEVIGGYGRVRLGPDHQLFLVSFVHQLHCVQQIAYTLINTSYTTPTHMHHCFNYLRQNLLCEAAESLEEGDFMGVDYSQDRQGFGASLVCNDWEAAYEALGKNFQEFSEWSAEWN